MNAYNLGRWARTRYNTLINNEPYSTSLLQIMSGSYDRTVTSAQLFLAGFYPPTYATTEIWNKKIDWQPISILSLPRLHDRVSSSFLIEITFMTLEVKNSEQKVEISQLNKARM